MKPNLRFTKITDKWKNTILNSQAINDYCIDKYGVKPKIIIGMDVDSLIKLENCPAICIFPDIKNEGLDQNEYTYSLIVGWSIQNENVIEDIENVYELQGWRESDELGNLIYKELADCGIHPLSKVDFQLFSGWQPQFPGMFQVEIKIPITLGTEIDY